MNHRTVLFTACLLFGACTTMPVPEAPPQPATADDESDLGILWVKGAAEYKAISRQVYGLAERDLPGYVADKSWSALPQQHDADQLPPAVILDVDETVVSNYDFQESFEPPFTNRKHYDWYSTTPAVEVQGVASFVASARELGVTVFFVTNRPCEIIAGIDHPCPPKLATVENIRQVGIDTDETHVFLSEEQGWTREKLTRRMHVAENYRVIMLFGDDYGDFVPCARKKVVDPCTIAATIASRDAALDEYDRYWGRGWYVLPNPMHGSWTSVE